MGTSGNGRPTLVTVIVDMARRSVTAADERRGIVNERIEPVSCIVSRRMTVRPVLFALGLLFALLAPSAQSSAQSPPPFAASAGSYAELAADQQRLFDQVLQRYNAIARRVAHGVHTYATEHAVPHIWRVDSNAHDTGAMSANFYHFAQKLFRE